jgi:Sortase domain
MTEPGRHRKSRTRAPIAWIALAACLLAVGGYFRIHADQGTPRTVSEIVSGPSDTSTTSTSPSPTPTSSPIPGVLPTLSTATPSAASTPIHLSIAAIGVSTALQPLGLLANGTLQSPAKWDVAGWYAGGIYPGQIGPAVIAGHIDSVNGPAVFYRLRELTKGATVTITEQDGQVLTFAVDTLQSFPKNQFPDKAVYAPSPDSELRLITCTGDFDWSTHNYLSNLVVSAHLV